jgi:hypothetical protein
MFELFTPITQTYVIDTGGSTTMDVAFSIHDGKCPGTPERLACSSSTTVPPSKRCDSVTYNDLALLLTGPHTYCLVVSETAPGSEGSITLRVFAGGLPATPLYADGQPIDGDTCSGSTLPSPACVSPGGDRGAAASVVVVCPSKDRLTGSIVPDAMLTPAVSVHAALPSGPQLACSTGAAPGATLAIDLASLPAATPLWFVVEPATSTCGSFRISLAE